MKGGFFMLTACIYTLGCRVNQYESDAIMQELKENGIEIVQSNLPCNICIINTCSVTAESDRKSKQIIRRLIKKNPSALIVVTGCFSQINPQEALDIEGVDFVFGNNDKSLIAKKIIELVSDKFSKTCSPSLIMSDINNGKFDSMSVGAPLTRTRAFIKIQDGCDSKCAYCIIPKARGCVRSDSPSNILAEVKRVVQEGGHEIVLTGIETASYGKDFKNGYSLGDLLTQVNEIDGVKRIRLGSLDPFQITKEFVDKIKTLDKMANHFHISMQSGCSKTLKEMKRKYNIDMAKERLDYLRAAFDGVMLSCDVITGFPNESEEDFLQTCEFFKNEEFLHLHIFPYSKRKGTVACEMENQVDEGVKKERLHKLEDMQKSIKAKLLNSFIEKEKDVEVLFESYDGEYILGHTTNFIEVKVKSDRSYSGEFLLVKPISTDGEFVYAKLI